MDKNSPTGHENHRVAGGRQRSLTEPNLNSMSHRQVHFPPEPGLASQQGGSLLDPRASLPGREFELRCFEWGKN